MRILLFLISYIPLYIIIIFNIVARKYLELSSGKYSNVFLQIFESIKKSLEANPFYILSMLILIFIPLILFFLILKYRLRKNIGNDENPLNLKTTNDTIVSYLMTYIIPFTSIGMDANPVSIMSSGLLFLTVLILFVRLNVVYLNPPLILLGFNIYSDENDNRKYLTRNSMVDLQTARARNKKLKVTRLTDDFRFISKYNPDN